MLDEIFNSFKEAHGQDYFSSRVSDEIVQNLHPKFELREYQKEALGRFDFYFNGYQKRQSKENVLTEEDFEEKDIVLISDEAHHRQKVQHWKRHLTILKKKI